MTIGSALANLLSADTDEKRKAASKELVEAQKSIKKEFAALGCEITFGETSVKGKSKNEKRKIRP